MEIKEKKLTNLIDAEYNPRTLTEKQFNDIKNSFVRFGVVNPIVVNMHPERKNIIVGGHQRARVARDMGMITIFCVEVNLDKDKERELNIRLNQNTGSWDMEGLANNFEVEELKEWGFEDFELGGLIVDEPGTEGNTDPDHVPEPPKEATTKPGQIFQLGKHRLMCGDSTKIVDVEKLMDGKKADMVFTDPPYGVSIKGGKGNNSIAGDLTQTAIPFSFDLAVKLATKENARFYFCGAEMNLNLYEKLFERFLNQMPRHLIWVKNGFVMKPNNYHNQYEIIYYGYGPKGGGLNCWYGGRKEDEASDVWKIKRDPSNTYLHPTQKPVELCERAIRNSSESGSIVYEPFCGSGSTLIACEKTNRICYGMEIDPIYCDVIIKRWEEFTGNKAKLI